MVGCGVFWDDCCRRFWTWSLVNSLEQHTMSATRIGKGIETELISETFSPE